MIFRTFLFILVGASIFGCDYLDPNPGPSSAFSIEDTDPSPTLHLGVELYGGLCERCHGARALGGAVVPFSIQGVSGIGRIVREGTRGMPAFPNITNNQILAIELYLGAVTKNGHQRKNRRWPDNRKNEPLRPAQGKS